MAWVIRIVSSSTVGARYFELFESQRRERTGGVGFGGQAPTPQVDEAKPHHTEDRRRGPPTPRRRSAPVAAETQSIGECSGARRSEHRRRRLRDRGPLEEPRILRPPQPP